MRQFAALLVLVIILPAYGQEKSAKPTPDAKHNSNSKQPEPQTPPTPPTAQINVINQQTPDAQENKAKNHHESYLSRLFAPENLPNICLFFAGIAGIIIATCTLMAIRGQTEAVLKSVRAAEQSTNVLQQAERGRVVIYWDQLEHIDLGPTRIVNGPLLHCFNWHCRNEGRTQIEVVKTWSRLIAINSLIELPEKPDYSAANARSYVGEPLQPNATKQQTPWFSAILETDMSFHEMQDKVHTGKCVLYAYGYVEYRDVWGQTHIFRFGVVRAISHSILEDNWFSAGPPAYNSSSDQT